MTDPPSQWIYVENPSALPDTENVGKWLIFVSPTNFEEVWERIAAETVAGRLGCAAKAATEYQMAYVGSTARVICVYTVNGLDRDDTMRVRERLRELGHTNKLPYKLDRETLAGHYRGKGRRVSLYYE